jgi:hypothetical protein
VGETIFRGRVKNFQVYLSLIHGFLSPYFPKKKKIYIYMLPPEKKGLIPEIFLILSTPVCDYVDA